MQNRKLGVDIGGVIRPKMEDLISKPDPGDFLSVPAHEHAIEKLVLLGRVRFPHQIYVISKVSLPGETRSRQWFAHHHFYEETGISPDYVHYCRERHEKAAICKKLGITHFADDRLEVLSYMIGLVSHLYLFKPRENEVQRYSQHLYAVKRVENWEELADKLLRD